MDIAFNAADLASQAHADAVASGSKPSCRFGFGLQTGKFEKSETRRKEAMRCVGAGHIFFPNGVAKLDLSKGLGYEGAATNHAAGSDVSVAEPA